MPSALPETKLPKPRGHALDSPLPQPVVLPQIMTCQGFWTHELCLISRLMQMLVTAATGTIRMWSQQGKYDSITASPRDLLADGPRDLGHAPAGSLTEASSQLDQPSMFAFCDDLRIIFQRVPSFIVQLPSL